MFYLGISIVLAAIMAVCVFSASSHGKKLSSFAVCGAIIGTFVGGASTIGTAQLAYSYGFSGWLYTLGGFFGVILLFPFFRPLREKNLSTVSDIVQSSYGLKCAQVFTFMNIAGSFLSLVSQVMSGSALLESILPLSNSLCIILISLLIFGYVVFGGVAALGKAGIVKVILITAGAIGCGIYAISLCGGFRGFSVLDPKLYNRLFARGTIKDLGSIMSVVVGIAVSQSYILAVANARTKADLNLGLAMTMILTPLVGLGGVFIGKYMRIAYPAIDPKLAFPLFLRNHLSPMLCGMMYAVLIITIMGSGAGISYAIANLLRKNIFNGKHKLSDKALDSVFLLVVISLAALLCLANLGNLILSWSFLSMALRGAVGFVPVMLATFSRKRIRSPYIMASMVSALVISLLGKVVLPENLDSLFICLPVSLAICLLGTEKDSPILPRRRSET